MIPSCSCVLNSLVSNPLTTSDKIQNYVDFVVVMKFVDLQDQMDKQFQQMQDQMKVLFSYRSKSTTGEETQID